MRKIHMTGLHYTDRGRGEMALVFLHFFGGSSNTWIDVVEELVPRYRCICVDLNGFGKSRVEEYDTSLDDQTQFVLELLTELRLSNFALIGHSMGGKIAQSVASHQPVGLRCLILIAPSPATPEPIEDSQRAALEKAFGNRAATEEIVKKLTVAPLDPAVFESVVEDHLAISEEAWMSWLEEGSRRDISASVKKITVPISVVSGSEDKNLSSDFLQKEFKKYYPEMRFVEIPDAGHVLPLEKPKEISILIGSFAKNESAVTSA